MEKVIITGGQGFIGSNTVSYFLDRVPGVYVRLGVGDAPPLHNSRLLPADEVMKNGIRYLVAFALDALKK